MTIKFIFRLFLEELVDFVEQSPKPNVAKYWKEILHLLPPPLCNSFKPHTWKQLYSLAQVNSSLTRVQMISYDQKIVRIIIGFLHQLLNHTFCFRKLQVH